IADGGPGWLNLIVLLFIWNAIKFIIMGPISFVLLTRARIQESVARRRARADQATRDESAGELMIGMPR
ncbi:MAG: sulfate permease, partial [Candidatus Bipolaricaulia bacterium]